MSTDLGCYGHPIVKSPHIDRFAKESLLFEDVHCQVALCTASRTSIVMGVRPTTSGIVKIDDPMLETLPNTVSLSRHFRDNGYYAVRVGKYTDPRSGPLDEAFDTTYEEWGVESNELVFKGLEEAISQDRPFFLAVGYKQAHDPWTPSAESRALYEPSRISVEHRTSRFQYKGEVTELSERQMQEMVCDYYGEISDVDRLVGSFLDELKGRGLFEKTIILVGVFDHGFSLGYHERWGKTNVWDIETEVPLMVRVPGNPNNGKRSSGIVELVDVYPTLVDLCDLPLPPQELEGTSFVPLLDHPDRAWKKAAFTHGAYNLPLTGVKTKAYNLVHDGEKAPMLFDRVTDPLNLIDISSEHPDLVSDLLELKQAGWRAALPE
ncbi:sulfatase-like hydrolase/transferase [Pelagicoccus mobilis]|uniref:Sulfatase-like hydrolase/transferase n=2 Tax=Pelagicoccus mobilis TaxID=415221 RepID=A0A934S4Q8_9BACT|nr:sulfatase-like hydrolase/transferase [Pelagicoccus mobilis]